MDHRSPQRQAEYEKIEERLMPDGNLMTVSLQFRGVKVAGRLDF
jgi:hypothetical protein